MFLVSPIWLVLLAPWMGLVIWLLRGRLDTRAVPFLELWGRKTAENPRPQRAWRSPPPALIALLAAILLAIVAATGPVIRKKSSPAGILPANVIIETVAVRAAPTTQAMIRLSNQSDLTAAKLTVRAGGAVVSEDVNLPDRGRARNYFVDLPVSGSTIDAEVLAAEIDHHLQATWRAAWPIVEARGPLPPELNRMIQVYARHRPSGEGSKHIAVTVGSENLTADEPMAVLMNPRSGIREISTIQPLIVRDSPLTRSVDWGKSLFGAIIESPPPGDWQPIVSTSGIVAVATREEPFKQVWVGFSSDEFQHQADFVIIWSNIFNWLGDADGNYHAAAPAPIPSPAATEENARPLGGPAFLVALALIVSSALTWKAPRVTGHRTTQS